LPNMSVRLASSALLGLVLVSAPLPDAGLLWAAEETDANGPPRNLLAPRCDHDLAIGRAYIGKHDDTAAVGRFKIMVQKCPRSSGTPEALAFLAERYLVYGMASEAQTAVAVLEREFPDARSTIEARNALRSAGLTPAEDEKSWIASAYR
jgi:hypothetical protein